VSKVELPRWRWGVVWLLFLATLINYMDRQALAGTQRYLLPEYEPDPTKQTALYGQIQFAFGLSFALFQIVAGFLVDRFPIRWLYPAAIVLWSAAGVATGFVPGGAVGGLIVCRVVLGIGEAFNWPCAVATVRRIIPRESRGLANGIFHGGGSLGAMAMPFLVLAIVETMPGDNYGKGWRELFVVVGAVGFLWALLWWLLVGGGHAKPIDVPPVAELGEAVGTDESLGRVMLRPTFALAVGILMCINICWHFYNTWFPRYLTEDMKVDGRTEQRILAGFYIAADVGSVGFGWLSRVLVRRGRSVEGARQLVLVTLALIAAAGTLCAIYGFSKDELPRWGCFFLVAAAVMGGFSAAFAGIQDAAGRHTAQILGIGGCLSWLCIAGLSLFVGGYAVPGKYELLFVIVGFVPLVAAGLGLLWPKTADQRN